MENKKSEYVPVDCLQVPKILFRDSKYKALSVDAKVLYSLLLDRMTFAVYNDWIDVNGKKYVLYPKSEMKKDLNATRYRVDLAMEELCRTDQMVVVTQPNPGKACQIYVKDITNKQEEIEGKNDMRAMKMKELEHQKEARDVKMENTCTVCQKEGAEGQLRAMVTMYLELAQCFVDRVEEIMDEFINKMADELDPEEMEQILQLIDQENDADSDEDIEEEHELAYSGLYLSGMTDKAGKINHQVVEMRSSLAAITLAEDIRFLAENTGVDKDEFAQALSEGCEAGDQQEVAQIILAIYLLHNFPSDFADDFACVQGNMEVMNLYIDNFVAVLKKELTDNKEEE